MRILICGDRKWTNWKMILDKLLPLVTTYTVIIDGHAKGADRIAHALAYGFQLSSDCYPARWDKYGKAAGPIRNRQMLEEGKPDLVWAFHNDIQHSKGTANMVQQAHAAGIPYEVFTEGSKLALEAS